MKDVDLNHKPDLKMKKVVTDKCLVTSVVDFYSKVEISGRQRVYFASC